MSLSVSATLPDGPDAGNRWTSGARKLGVAGAVLGLAYLPLLILHARLLWAREHYHFFPLLLPGAAALAYHRYAGPRALAPGSRRATYALAGLAWGVLALAIVLPSPELGAAAALVLLLAIVHGLGGASLVRRLLPAWLLLWLAVPPPGPLDGRLVASFQRLSSHWASQALEVLGVLHARFGDVLEVGGRPLMVEEACSGIHSLLPVLACTLFWLGWYKRPFAHWGLLLAAAFPSVLVGNVARIVAVASLDGRAGLNLSQGWAHEALGFLLFAGMLGLVWSTDHALLFLAPLPGLPGRWIRARREAERLLFEPPPLPSITPPPAPTTPDPSPFQPPDWRALLLTARPIVAGFGLLAATQGTMLARSWATIAPPVTLPAGTVQALEALGETALPEQSGAWRRQGFEVKEREPGYWLGRFSRMWHYQSGERTAAFALYYPFNGWKEVTACYDSQGWRILERTTHAGQNGSGPYVSASLYRPGEDRHAYMLFQIRDHAGRPLTPRGFWIWARLRHLALKLWPWAAKTGNDIAADTLGGATYQLQLLVESPAALEPAQQREAQALFGEFLGACARHGMPGRGH